MTFYIWSKNWYSKTYQLWSPFWTTTCLSRPLYKVYILNSSDLMLILPFLCKDTCFYGPILLKNRWSYKTGFTIRSLFYYTVIAVSTVYQNTYIYKPFFKAKRKNLESPNSGPHSATSSAYIKYQNIQDSFQNFH